MFEPVPSTRKPSPSRPLAHRRRRCPRLQSRENRNESPNAALCCATVKALH